MTAKPVIESPLFLKVNTLSALTMINLLKATEKNLRNGPRFTLFVMENYIRPPQPQSTAA